jgi:cell division septation protein DedD
MDAGDARMLELADRPDDVDRIAIAVVRVDDDRNVISSSETRPTSGYPRQAETPAPVTTQSLKPTCSTIRALKASCAPPPRTTPSPASNSRNLLVAFILPSFRCSHRKPGFG